MREPRARAGGALIDPGPRRLDPRVRSLWRLLALFWSSVATVLLVVAAAAVALTTDFPWPAAAAVALVTAASCLWLAWWLPGLAYRSWTFEVAEETLELRHGIAFRTAAAIPYFRVQHVDTKQGPIERRFGLTSLRLRTAAAGTDGSVPGLRTDDAHDLRETILRRAGAGDAV